MPSPPISQAEIDARGDHIDELLELCGREAPRNPNDLSSSRWRSPFRAARPFARWISAVAPAMSAELSGGSTRRRTSTASIETDSHVNLSSRNQRAGIPKAHRGRSRRTTAGSTSAGNYDVVATVNAMHWFDEQRGEQLIRMFTDAARRGSSCRRARLPETPRGWIRRVEGEAPPRYTRGIGSGSGRGLTLMATDHALGPPDANRIGDKISVAGWMHLIERAGFELSDVLEKRRSSRDAHGKRSAARRRPGWRSGRG